MTTWDHVAWNNCFDKLLNSRDSLLNKLTHWIVGIELYGGNLYTIPFDLPNPSFWILGPTGSGKTSCLLDPFETQAMHTREYSLLKLDGKPTIESFHNARATAFECGYDFRWWTNMVGCNSYVFNYFSEAARNQLTVNQDVQILLQALGKIYDEAYGADHFQAVEEMCLRNTLIGYPSIDSLAALAKILNDPNAYKRFGDMAYWQQTTSLRSIINRLAALDHFNATPALYPERPEVFRAMLDMGSLIARPTYFYIAIDTTREKTTARTIPKLMAYAAFNACKYRTPEQQMKVIVVMDEAQEFLGPSMSEFLEQGRSYGIRLALSHQHRDQLLSNSYDLRGLVESCCGTQIIFAPTDLSTRELIQKTCGEGRYTDLSWRQIIYGGMNTLADAEFDVKKQGFETLFDVPQAHVVERYGPLIEPNRLIEMSAAGRIAFVRTVADLGYARAQGYWVPVLTTHHITERLYKERKRRPWPPPNPFTVPVTKENAFERYIRDGSDEDKQQLKDVVRRMRERREQERERKHEELRHD